MCSGTRASRTRCGAGWRAWSCSATAWARLRGNCGPAASPPWPAPGSRCGPAAWPAWPPSAWSASHCPGSLATTHAGPARRAPAQLREGQFLERQYLEAQCLEAQCLEAQCLEARLLEAQILQRRLDSTVERGVGVDHLAQPPDRHPLVHGQGEQAQHLAAGRPGRGGPDEDALAGVGDQLDEPVVARLVDPAPGGAGNRVTAGPHVEAAVPGLGLREADRPDLRAGEG